VEAMMASALSRLRVFWGFDSIQIEVELCESTERAMDSWQFSL